MTCGETASSHVMETQWLRRGLPGRPQQNSGENCNSLLHTHNLKYHASLPEKDPLEFGDTCSGVALRKSLPKTCWSISLLLRLEFKRGNADDRLE